MEQNIPTHLLILLLITNSAAIISNEVADQTHRLAHFVNNFSSLYLIPEGSSRVLVLCQATSEGFLSKIRPHVFESLLTRHDHQKIVTCPRRGGTKIEDGTYSYILAGPARGVQRQVGYIPPVVNRSSHARLLVLVWDCDHGVLRSILQRLWDRAWARVVVAIDNGDNILALFTMAPYLRNDGICGQSGVDAVFLGNVSVDGKIGLSQHEESMFTDVVPRDLRGCTVRVCHSTNTVDSKYCSLWDTQLNRRDPVDVLKESIIKTAAKYGNFAVKWIDDTTTLFNKFTNGSFSGSLGRLQRGECDFAVGLFGLLPSRIQYLQPTCTVVEVTQEIHIRCQGHQRKRGHLSTILARLWLSGLEALLVLSAITTIIAKVLVARYSVGWSSPRTSSWWTAAISRSALDTWSQLVEVTMPPAQGVLPSTQSGRYVSAAWLIFALNVNVAVKGLLSAESADATVPAPTLEELLNDPRFSIGVWSGLQEVALLEMGITENHFTQCEGRDGLRDCEKRFHAEDRFGVIRGREVTVTFRCLPPCTYKLSSTLTPQQVVFYARKAYPLLPMIDKVILRLHSSGILQQWIKQDWWEMAQGKLSLYTTSSMTARVEWDAFFILFAGLALSAAAFIFEVSQYAITALFFVPRNLRNGQLALRGRPLSVWELILFPDRWSVCPHRNSLINDYTS